MAALIALRAVFGQDEANHGTRRYRVGGDGLVHVPATAALFLIEKGGFAVTKTTVDPVAESMSLAPFSQVPRRDAEPGSLLRLHHDAAAGCNHDRSKYQSGKNGDMLVPVETAFDLKA